MGDGWIRVSRQNPCIVCSRPDWCGITRDGNVAHCMRVPSPHPCPSGGWFHFLREMPRREYVPRIPRKPTVRLFNANATMLGFRAEFEMPGGGKDLFDSLLEIANDLRLPAVCIDRLEVGRSAFHRAWAYPTASHAAAANALPPEAETGFSTTRISSHARRFTTACAGGRSWWWRARRTALRGTPWVCPASGVHRAARGLTCCAICAHG